MSERVRKTAADTKIMLVDDGKAIRNAGVNFLTEYGYQVFPIVDGYEALTAVVEIKPDLILLDIQMPRLDGYDTCKMIRSNEKFKDTPIIMVSGNDSPFDIAKGKMLGCEDYIVKPFKKEILVATIRKYLPLPE